MPHRPRHSLRQTFQKVPRRVRFMSIGLMAGIFVVLGVTLIRASNAANLSVQIEAESGQLSGNQGQGPTQGASGGASIKFGSGGGPVTPPSTETPTFTATDVVTSLSNPWDISFFSDGGFIFSQRAGALRYFKDGQSKDISGVGGLAVNGEGGLMGVAVDPQFVTNRYVYACYSSSGGDIKTSRWKISDDMAALSEKKDIVTGILAWQGKGNWHAGCRIAFGPDGYLWITTGDAGTAGSPQDIKGLAGKILRVDREGAGASGNMGGDADPRVYNYGHRNPQGIAFFPSPKNGVPGLNAEHGPRQDDEVNELRVGGNFGWSSASDGGDSGSMTDKSRFPNAIDAIWKSGSPTQAPSGMAIINNPAWKGWDGAAVVAMQTNSDLGRHMKVLRLDAQNKVTKEERALDGTFGRLRQIKQAPDGSLYVLTDNGSGDKIIKLTPNP